MPRARHGQHVVDVRRSDQYHQQNEAQVRDPIEHGLRTRRQPRTGLLQPVRQPGQQHEQKQ